MEKHEETIKILNLKYFDVYSLDWRGQGLSSRMLPNPYKGFVKTYDDYTRDLYQFITTIVKPKAREPLIILSHSMGGHIAVRYLHDFPGIISKAILISPMIDINTYPFPKRFARLLTFFAYKSGMGHLYAPGKGDYYPTSKKTFVNNVLTSDFKRYMDEKYAVDKNPALGLGGVTYGWLQASFESIDIIKTPGYVNNINIPVLLISAGSDRVVCINAQKALCKSMKYCIFISISNAYHEILKESSHIYDQFWHIFDKFISKNT
ncbi:Serine aminopeptidase, S33-type [Desulfonema limicola]|uniref:Serine aminopeptidase, S33-type n=1 Tax=Desulfonema limicola TaxID=45656 RepID=A0A975BAG1_9BACT|nr:Serine aminopeptidase, S33-type [Desulfonema limicola]